MKSILLIEDDETITLGIRRFLAKNEYEVTCVNSIALAKAKIFNEPSYSLILLDLNLPDGSGYSFCEYVKARQDIPIIFITICDEDGEVIKGLELGADDYIVKPFRLNVLLARINAILRRTEQKPSNNKISCGNVTIDKAKQQAYVNNEKVELTASEYKLLTLLLENKEHVLSRTILLARLWDVDGNFVNDNTLTVTMKRLREKLNHPSFIKTVRGIGYLVEETHE